MFIEFKHTLRKFRGNILGWGIGLAAYSLLMAFFGRNFTSLSSLEGYLDVYFFNTMTVILGILAVGAGTKLLTKDEEDVVLVFFPDTGHQGYWRRRVKLEFTR